MNGDDFFEEGFDGTKSNVEAEYRATFLLILGDMLSSDLRLSRRFAT